jgi:glycosyltransferase involved in cell wall biosynthesis
VFLTTARLIEAKNIGGMLRAFARASSRTPDIVYLIAGQGELLSELQVLAARLGVADRVRFLGHLRHEHLRYVYHLSDVFLFSTLYEGQPRAVIESLMSGLPVICSNYGGVCELVENDRSGLWVDPLDVEAIAEAICRLASDAQLRATMSECTAFDAAGFSVEAVNRREAEFYLRTIRQERDARRLLARAVRRTGASRVHGLRLWLSSRE